MIERLERTKKEIIRLHFANEPFYHLCKVIHREFLDQRCTIPISPEELFIDGIYLLDELISFPEKAFSRCENLWTDSFGEYRVTVRIRRSSPIRITGINGRFSNAIALIRRGRNSRRTSVARASARKTGQKP